MKGAVDVKEAETLRTNHARSNALPLLAGIGVGWWVPLLIPMPLSSCNQRACNVSGEWALLNQKDKRICQIPAPLGAEGGGQF